jgi:hypothetical protein
LYDLIDRPVADLPTLDARMLAATRAWVHRLTMAGTADVAAADSLGAGGRDLDAALRALDAGSTEVIAFERPCAPAVSETEAVWLSIARLVRADRLVAARAALEGMADPASARTILAGLVRAVVA